MKVSHLCIIPNRFYESPKLKNWMCELCTFSQIRSHILFKYCCLEYHIVGYFWGKKFHDFCKLDSIRSKESSFVYGLISMTIKPFVKIFVTKCDITVLCRIFFVVYCISTALPFFLTVSSLFFLFLTKCLYSSLWVIKCLQRLLVLNLVGLLPPCKILSM